MVVHRSLEDSATGGSGLRAEFVATVREIQSFPYSWPGPPDAAAARSQRAGTCASKHALLAEELTALGLIVSPLLVAGPLVPPIWPDLMRGGAGLVEIHECVTVLTPWAGPLLVDVTWPAAAVAAGLGGVPPAWNGSDDTGCAIAPIQASYAVPPGDVRRWKLMLRERLSSPGDLARREVILREIAARVSAAPDR
jgi:hypothetical protein